MPRPILLCLLLALSLPAGATAFPRVPGNPADALRNVAMDEGGYDPAAACFKRPQRGTLLLQDWLARSTGGESWGILRCEKWGPGSASLHAEGRAIDWRPPSAGAGRRLVSLLLAPDRAGQPTALARRMGVQGVIFRCRQWFGSGDSLGPYGYCYDKRGKLKKGLDPTAAHMDHVHVELSWPGARGRTSFWQRVLRRR